MEPERVGAIRFTKDAEGGVLLHLSANTFFTLNHTGARTWEMLQQSCSIREIVDALTAETASDPLMIEADMQEFLDQLHRFGLYPPRAHASSEKRDE